MGCYGNEPLLTSDLPWSSHFFSFFTNQLVAPCPVVWARRLFAPTKALRPKKAACKGCTSGARRSRLPNDLRLIASWGLGQTGVLYWCFDWWLYERSLRSFDPKPSLPVTTDLSGAGCAKSSPSPSWGPKAHSSLQSPGQEVAIRSSGNSSTLPESGSAGKTSTRQTFKSSLVFGRTALHF